MKATITSTSASSPLLSVQNAGVSFWQRTGMFRGQHFWALKDVSFDLFRGESLGVVGRNAAGKSTLMQLLAGIIDPNRGSITSYARSATLLSLGAGFLPNLTGRENALLNGLMLGMTEPYIRAHLADIKEFSELGEFFEQPVVTYSSGMVARLGFSAAIFFDPEILIVDEALGVGDKNFREKSSAAMQEKLRSNSTVVLVSHNPATIRTLCDRAIWLEQGETLKEGNVGEVMDSYEEFLSEQKGSSRGLRAD